MAKRKKPPTFSSPADRDDPAGRGSSSRPLSRPPDVEPLIREAIRKEINRIHGPLVAQLAVARVLGGEMWDLRAKEPVPPEFMKQIPALRPVLRAELDARGIPQDAVAHWIGKALQVQAIEAEAGHGKGKPPRLAAAAEQELRDMTKLLEGGTYLLSARPELEADARRLQEVVVPRLRQLDRTVERLIREDVLGAGRPRALGVRLAAEGLTQVMKMHTPKPQVGLVAAILKDTAVLRDVPCWVPSPLSGKREQERMWCQRAGGGGSSCPRDPLRCAVATGRVKAILKTRKGRKPSS